MKIACTGDIHLHEYKDYSSIILVEWDEEDLEFIPSREGMAINSRLLDGLQALIDIRKHCEANNIKVLLLAGDLNHKRGAVSTIVHNQAVRVFESFKARGINVVAIPGNHDQVSNVDVPENSLFGLKNYISLLCTDDPVECGTVFNGDEKVVVCGLAFSKNKEASMQGLELAIRESDMLLPDVPRVLLAHVGINGGFVGKSSYALKDQYSAEDLEYGSFNYVVLGHYHKPQRIAGAKNMFYTGSPVQNNFNDEGEDHGFWVIDTNKKNSLEFIPLESPKFITITAENAGSIDIGSNFVRVKAKADEVEAIMDKLVDEKYPDRTIRVEVTKEYSSEDRCGIEVGMSYEQIIETFASSKGVPSDIGLEIYRGALRG